MGNHVKTFMYSEDIQKMCRSYGALYILIVFFHRENSLLPVNWRWFTNIQPFPKSLISVFDLTVVDGGHRIIKSSPYS